MRKPRTLTVIATARSAFEAAPRAEDVPSSTAERRRAIGLTVLAALVFAGCVSAALLLRGDRVSDVPLLVGVVVLVLWLLFVRPSLAAMRWNRAYGVLAAQPRRAQQAHILTLDPQRNRSGSQRAISGEVEYADADGRTHRVPMTSVASGVLQTWEPSLAQQVTTDSPVAVWHTPDHSIAHIIIWPAGSVNGFGVREPGGGQEG